MQAIDFTEVSEPKAELQCGKYLVAISKVKDKVSKSSGNDMWELEFKVIAGKHAGKTILDFLVFKGKDEKATKALLGKIKKLYRVIKGEEFANSKFTPKTEDLLGSTLMIEVVPKTEKFINSAGEEKESTKPTVAFAGYYEDSEYSEIFDQQLFNAYQPKKEESADCDDLIGEDEIAF